MSFIGVNPRRNPMLDALRRPVVELRGLPVPLPPTLAELPGQKSGTEQSPMDVMHELVRRLEQPRPNRQAIMEEMAPKMKEGRDRFFGTAQQHVMLQFQDALFAAFALGLMTPDESASFLTHWRLRGLSPAKIEACKDGGFWSYRLIEEPTFS